MYAIRSYYEILFVNCQISKCYIFDIYTEQVEKIMNFLERILPADKKNSFSMDDYWVWCGSVIKGDDGKYHMFSSRWPKKYPFFNGYVAYSEIVRAVSDTPEGPYEYCESVLPARGSQYSYNFV